jgi:hypothetical protein
MQKCLPSQLGSVHESVRTSLFDLNLSLFLKKKSVQEIARCGLFWNPVQKNRDKELQLVHPRLV